MDIAFNINRLGMEGLGATLSSLIQHCHDSQKIKFHFLCSDLTEVEKKDINYLAEMDGFEGEIHFLDFDAKQQFGHLKSLHGDWTPYGRLLIPQWIEAEKVLYLDADLVVLLDVLTLENFNLEGSPLGATQAGDAQYSWDADFYLHALGFAPDVQVFNSGVLLFDIKAWHRQEMDQQCNAIAKSYAHRFASADQTLLNAVCAGQFALLPRNYNRAWTPMDKQTEVPGNEIIHFVGSPKPWDLFGKKVHSAHALWKRYNPPFWEEKYNQFSKNKLYRTWRIKKSIVRAMIK